MVAGMSTAAVGESDAELGAAVRLFALAPHDFGLARRHDGAVETEVEGGGIAELGFDDAAFIPGDLASESLGVAFHRRLGQTQAAFRLAQQAEAPVPRDPAAIEKPAFPFLRWTLGGSKGSRLSSVMVGVASFSFGEEDVTATNSYPWQRLRRHPRIRPATNNPG